MQEWLGFGPSAASQYNGERYRRPADLNKWINGMQLSQPLKEEPQTLDTATLMVDAIIFGLRMNAGINLEEIDRRFKLSKLMVRLKAFFKRLAEEGLLLQRGSHVVLTHKGRLIYDAIGTAILEYADPGNHSDCDNKVD